MEAPQKPPNGADRGRDDEIELLKLEYQKCQDGYNSRDSIVESEFCQMVQVFWYFLTIIFAFSIFTSIGRPFHCTVCFVIGMAGLLCLLSLLVSIESNASCNMALRRRCTEIERRLQDLSGTTVGYWQAIEGRKKHWEEKVLKKAWGRRSDTVEQEQERNVFINTVRLFILLWIIIVAVTIVEGSRSDSALATKLAQRRQETTATN